MRERPILFSAPMVRAILGGTKTQTRRIVKPKRDVGSGIVRNAICPYGKPGDRLWVRETWLQWECPDHGQAPCKCIGYPALRFRADDEIPAVRWKPSIFMPRWASRITLEVTGVRAERLQDISEADAIDEGLSEFIGGWWCAEEDGMQQAGSTPQDGYRHLWERINGAGSWDANPFVWVVSFTRVGG